MLYIPAPHTDEEVDIGICTKTDIANHEKLRCRRLVLHSSISEWHRIVAFQNVNGQQLKTVYLP